MHITTLFVSNFRAIEMVSLDDLRETVVIAGPNGSGKSSLFDAIRLWKSSFGDYHSDEVQQWFGEFQVRADANGFDVSSLLRDKSKPLQISAVVQLQPEEKEYLRRNAEAVVRAWMWKGARPAPRPGQRRPRLTDQFAAHNDEVESDLKGHAERLVRELESTAFAGEISLNTVDGLRVSENFVLSIIFGTYLPESIGVVEYQPSQRTFQREQVGGIDLGLGLDERASQQALYNSAQKYQNLKQQLAASYLRERLATQAGNAPKAKESLSASLQELFRLFFPDKEFVGLVPNESGRFQFPIRTSAGIEHDIDDLSSGEREVLLGYLRLKNLAPRRSVLLIDEPELHLNPRLVRGLPQFYHKHLGGDLKNQIWLLTHSDVLVREALGQVGFSVLHMLPVNSGVPERTNQIRSVDVAEDVDRLVIDLVGEAAAYQPGRKVVIFEGGGSSEFDVSMTGTLFPSFRMSVNAISGSNRYRVRQLHSVLEEARGKLNAVFYSIVDRDSEEPEAERPTRARQWDSYHIENYLLEAKYVFEALRDALGSRLTLSTPQEVDQALQQCAESTMNGLVRDELLRWAFRSMKACINLGADPKQSEVYTSLRSSIESSRTRIENVANGDLSTENLSKREMEIRLRLRDGIKTNEWRRTFRGRDILKCFVSTHAHSMVAYEVFRNLVLSKMRDDGFQPAGMKLVIDSIMNDPT